MAIQQIPPGVMWSSMIPQAGSASSNPATMDAAGESNFTIGVIVWRGGSPGDTKTISAAGGGKMLFRTSTVTFANGTTNVRWGIQDMTAAGASGALEDGTFDVYLDLTSADSIASSTNYVFAMESGSKTLTYGAVYAFGCEMTARGGADSFIPFAANRTAADAISNFPYRTTDTGGGPTAASGQSMPIHLVFDDGTVGWIEGIAWCHTNASFTNATIQVGSTPDEYAAIFQIPVTMEIGAVSVFVGLVAAGTGDAFEVILYTDPLGTPSAAQTITADVSRLAATATTGSGIIIPLTTKYTLLAGTPYAVAVRPTTANTINYSYMQPGTNIGRVWKEVTPFSASTLKVGTRTNQSGAFSETDQDDVPVLILWPTGFDDGLGITIPMQAPPLIGSRYGIVSSGAR